MKQFFADRPRLKEPALGLAALVVLLLLTQLVLPGDNSPARGTPAAVLFRGTLYGFTSSLFVVGLILMYRTMRFINFAQGAFGSVAVTLMSYMMVFTSIPFPIVLILGVLASGALGVIAGLFLLRFFNASRLFLTVVSIVGSGFIFGSVLLGVLRLPFWPPPEKLSGDQLTQLRDVPGSLPFRGFTFHVGSFPVPFGFQHLLAIEVAAFALVAVVVFLKYTKAGAAVRAMAANPERAALLGIGVGGLSVMVWGIAAMLDAAAAFSVSIAAPDLGFGFTALHLPLAAAVVGRFEKIGTAVWASVLLGVARAAWFFSFDAQRGLFDLFVFGLIAGGLLLQRRAAGRGDLGAQVSWAATEEPRQIPHELNAVLGLRLARYGLITVGVLLVGFFPFLFSTRRVVLAGVIFITAICVLSLVVLTGWAGQVSLGQWGLVAVGSVVGGAFTTSVGIPFWFAIPLTMVVTGGVAVIVGLPALRIRGLFLLVVTFAFAILAQSVLFEKQFFGWLLVDNVKRPTLFFLNFEDETSMYYLCAASLGLCIWLVRNLRSSRIGRLLISVRENEANLASYGVNVVRAKLMAFAVSGALAGFAGILFAHHQRGVSALSFDAQTSVNVFVQAVIGGVSSAGGALLGTTYYQLVQEFAGSNAVLAPLLTGAVPLAILFMAPGGLISVVNGARDSVLRIVAQRRRIVVPSLFADYDPDVVERQLIPLAEPSPMSGLAALPPERYTMRSELYKGIGPRIVDSLGPKRESGDASAFRAAATAADEAAEALDAETAAFEATHPVTVGSED